MRRLLCSAWMICCLLLLTLTPAKAACVGAAEVSAEGLNFRAAPDLNGERLGVAPKGSVVLILSEEGGWCRVRWDGVEGYMSAAYLSPLEEAALELGVGILTGDAVRFRTEPNLSCGVLGYLFQGDAVTVTGVSGSWYRCVSEGETGYVHSDYVSLTTPDTTPTDVMQTVLDRAEACLGAPYLWGGTDAETGFDAPGFIQHCFLDAGISLPRSVSELMGEGEPVERSDLQAGDLLFFASPTAWAASHVGIYQHDGSFLHASSGVGTVIRSSLDDWYYDRVYLSARRIQP